MPNRVLRTFAFALLLTGTLAACGGGSGADAIPVFDLPMDKPATYKLKYWTQDRGAKGDAIKPNLHFDDGENVRVVLYGDAVMETSKRLEQNKVYTVTFTPTRLQQGKVTIIDGTLGAVK